MLVVVLVRDMFYLVMYGVMEKYSVIQVNLYRFNYNVYASVAYIIVCFRRNNGTESELKLSPNKDKK